MALNSSKRKPPLLVLTAAALSGVDPDQLDHVGLQQVDVPPGRLLHLCQGAGGQVEEGAGAAVHGLLGDPALGDARLHRRLPRGNVEHWR